MGYRTSVSAEKMPFGEVGRESVNVAEVTDLRQLRVFQCLAQNGSFTETARLMSVTQSAVSHSIKTLETTLGVSLFDRRTKRFALTKEGETLLVSASEVLRELGRASQKILRLRTGELNTLRFGSTDTICEFLLPKVLPRIAQEEPEATVILKIGDTEEIAHSLVDGGVDIMLGIRDPKSGAKGFVGGQSALLFEDTLQLIASPEHHSRSRVRSLGIEALNGERILLFGSHSITNRLVRDWLDRLRVKNVRLVDVRAIGALKSLVKAGFGIGLVPPWILDSNERTELLVDFSLPAAISRQWMLSMRSKHSSSQLEKRFVSLLRDATALLF